jgi:hypothetical protein
MSIILEKKTIKPTKVKIQTRNRGDGKQRYSSNYPKGFMDRLMKKYGQKKGTYTIDCVRILIEDGIPFLEIDETKEMI